MKTECCYYGSWIGIKHVLSYFVVRYANCVLFCRGGKMYLIVKTLEEKRFYVLDLIRDDLLQPQGNNI